MLTKYIYDEPDLVIFDNRPDLIKHAPGKHDQQSHAGGRGGVLIHDSAKREELYKKMADVAEAKLKITEKYPDAGYIYNENSPAYQEMSKEDQKEWSKLNKEWDDLSAERAQITSDYLEAGLKMKSGRSPDDEDMGLETPELRAIRDEYVVPDEKTLATNAGLRRTGRVTTKVKRFDSLVEQGEVKAPMRVYRGAVLKPEQIETLQPGSSFIDKGFQSTGVDMSDATFYVDSRARDIAGTKVLFEYDLQPGLNAVNVSYGEIVVQRGAKVTITGSSTRGEYKVFQAEVSKE